MTFTVLCVFIITCFFDNISGEKPGMCPVASMKYLGLLGEAFCDVKCVHDYECGSVLKCCSNGCGMHCTYPHDIGSPLQCPYGDPGKSCTVGSGQCGNQEYCQRTFYSGVCCLKEIPRLREFRLSQNVDEQFGAGHPLQTSTCYKALLKTKDMIKSHSLKSLWLVSLPRCTLFGDWQTVQCMDGTGLCWCTTPDGKRRPETVTRGVPNCSGAHKSLQASEKICPKSVRVARCDPFDCSRVSCDRPTVCRMNPCGACRMELHDLTNPESKKLNRCPRFNMTCEHQRKDQIKRKSLQFEMWQYATLWPKLELALAVMKTVNDPLLFSSDDIATLKNFMGYNPVTTLTSKQTCILWAALVKQFGTTDEETLSQYWEAILGFLGFLHFDSLAKDGNPVGQPSPVGGFRLPAHGNVSHGSLHWKRPPLAGNGARGNPDVGTSLMQGIPPPTAGNGTRGNLQKNSLLRGFRTPVTGNGSHDYPDGKSSMLRGIRPPSTRNGTRGHADGKYPLLRGIRPSPSRNGTHGNADRKSSRLRGIRPSAPRNGTRFNADQKSSMLRGMRPPTAGNDTHGNADGKSSMLRGIKPPATVNGTRGNADGKSSRIRGLRPPAAGNGTRKSADGKSSMLRGMRPPAGGNASSTSEPRLITVTTATPAARFEPAVQFLPRFYTRPEKNSSVTTTSDPTITMVTTARFKPAFQVRRLFWPRKNSSALILRPQYASRLKDLHVSTCSAEGFSSIQCNEDQCWCQTPDGQPVEGSLARKGQLNCSSNGTVLAGSRLLQCHNGNVPQICLVYCNPLLNLCNSKDAQGVCLADPCDKCSYGLFTNTTGNLERVTCTRRAFMKVAESPNAQSGKLISVPEDLSKCPPDEVILCNTTCNDYQCSFFQDAICYQNPCTCGIYFFNEDGTVKCNEVQPRCKRHRFRALKRKLENKEELWVPECDARGDFKPKQCNNDTCICMDDRGEIIQQSASTEITCEMKNAVKVSLKIKLIGSFSSEEDHEYFAESVREQLSTFLNVKKEMIQNIQLSKDDIIVNFDLVQPSGGKGGHTLPSLVDHLNTMILEEMIVFTINGRTMPCYKESVAPEYLYLTSLPTTSKPTTSNGNFSQFFIFVTSGTVFGVTVCVIGITVCYFLCRRIKTDEEYKENSNQTIESSASIGPEELDMMTEAPCQLCEFGSEVSVEKN